MHRPEQRGAGRYGLFIWTLCSNVRFFSAEHEPEPSCSQSRCGQSLGTGHTGTCCKQAQNVTIMLTIWKPRRCKIGLRISGYVSHVSALADRQSTHVRCNGHQLQSGPEPSASMLLKKPLHYLWWWHQRGFLSSKQHVSYCIYFCNAIVETEGGEIIQIMTECPVFNALREKKPKLRLLN